jgi:hypothetical protein
MKTIMIRSKIMNILSKFGEGNFRREITAHCVAVATLAVAALFLLPGTGSAQFVNGSFEIGDYTGWTLLESPPQPTFGTWGIATNGQTINPNESVFDFFDGINVTQTSPGLPHTYTATDGNFVALQLQNGPQTHRMFQDIALPSGVTTISWDLEYNNHSGGFDPNNQVLEVNVRNPANDAILATLFSTTQGVDPLSIPMTIFIGDVSAFSGQTVRISVDMTVNNFHFDATFDNFRPVFSLQECLYRLVEHNCDNVPRRDQDDCNQAQLDFCLPFFPSEPPPPMPPRR